MEVISLDKARELKETKGAWAPSMKIQPVDITYIHQIWPKVVEYIESALNDGDASPKEYRDYTIEHIKAFVVSGQWLLVVATTDGEVVHGAATISFLNTPNHRDAVITTTGGKFITSKDSLEQLSLIVKQRGATKLQAYGRDAMVRYLKRFNFEQRNTLMEILL